MKRNQEIIKLIDEIVEIIKEISYVFSHSKISRGENGMIFSYIGRQFMKISTLLEIKKISLKVNLNNNKNANHKLRRTNTRQH